MSAQHPAATEQAADSAPGDGAPAHARGPARFVLPAATCALTIVYLAATLAMPSPAIADPLGPQIFPLLICGGLLITTILLALEAWRRPPSPGGLPPGPPLAQSLRVVGGIAGWTAIYIACFEAVGFPIATTVFLAGLMVVFHGRPWVSLACAAGFSAAAWALFVGVLSVRLPAGVLPL